MMVIFISQSEKKAVPTVRKILDSFADRIGDDTWQTVITEAGLLAVKAALRRNATKSMAVSCRWIRSRSRSELLWVVGNRNKFNAEGIVPVNWTQKNVSHFEWENQWQFLPAIKALAAVSALLHDWGKTSDFFQKKLRRRGGKNRMDPFRHEWISCKLLEALIAVTHSEETDENWMQAIISGTVHEAELLKKIQENQTVEKQCHLGKLPALASAIVWLILSHHRMADKKGEAKDGYEQVERGSFESVLSHLSADWGYQNPRKEEFAVGDLAKCFYFPEGLLWEHSAIWQKELKKWVGRLHDVSISLQQGVQSEALTQRPAFRLILLYARLCLMIGDHYVSSKKSETKAGQTWSVTKLWANTDGQGGCKQYLEEHLVKVSAQALQTAHRLPFFAEKMERAYDIRGLKKQGTGAYAWQEKAVAKIHEYRKAHAKDTAWFIINMASTGCGKTIANAKIMHAISPDRKSLRYILALGLRSLTLQTGDSYRKQLGMDGSELAVLIGSDAIRSLHEREQEESDCGMESAASLMEENVDYLDTFDSGEMQFMTLFLGDTNQRADKNKALLLKPVLAATIDHMMGAVQTIKGGRYMLPFLRLMSSDLVIDEIDDFTTRDLYAIARLVHLAGMLGRNVGISSATIPPDLAEGMARAYRAGLSVYNDFFLEKKPCAVFGCDEFKSAVQEMPAGNETDFPAAHQKFVNSRCKKLKVQKIRRKGELMGCTPSTDKTDVENNFFEDIRKATEKMHALNHVIDQKTGKHISFGVVRMANINPCVELSEYLLRCAWSAGYAVRLMTYHSRQILLLRHEQEKYLDRVLSRKGEANQCVELTDPIIRRHIDESQEENILFIVVATPVEETGRDHDFDWAVIEPSSYRSIIQLSGRVMRHRTLAKDQAASNVAVMEYNLRGLKGEPKAFKWPGYEVGKYQLESHDMRNLIDVNDLASRIDAMPRIRKPGELHPESRLIDLEHQTMMDFNSQSDVGPQSMHGWIKEYWWLTGLPMEFRRFRENAIEDVKLTVRYTDGEETFCELDDHGSLVNRKAILHIDDYAEMTEEMERRLWIRRSYAKSVRQMIDMEDPRSEEEQIEQAERKYGEITMPKTSGDTHWLYSDQLGLFKERKG